jgi:hypothetical protein
MQPLFLAIAALLAAGMGGSPVKADTQVKPYSYYEGPLDAPKPLTRVEPLPRVEKEVYYTPGTYWTPSYYSQYYYPQVAYVNPAPGTYYYGVQPAAPAVVSAPAVAPVAVAPAAVAPAAVAPATYVYGTMTPVVTPVYSYNVVTYGPKTMPEGYIYKVNPVPPKTAPAPATYYGSLPAPGYYYYPRF